MTTVLSTVVTAKTQATLSVKSEVMDATAASIQDKLPKPFAHPWHAYAREFIGEYEMAQSLNFYSPHLSLSVKSLS